jgi:hypothetical protein
MSDFVTRLEAELHRAAVRQDDTGGLVADALPRLRLALPGFATAAIAVTAVAIALIAVTLFVGSESDRAAEGGVPAELLGAWRLPGGVELHAEQVPAELRLYPRGSQRCVRLGTDSKPCYAIENTQWGALEWGTVRISGDRIIFRAELRAYCGGKPCSPAGPEVREPGLYRWRVLGSSLELTPLRDPVAVRSGALGSAPLIRAGEPAPARIPERWTDRRFASRQYHYSIRYPDRWSVLAARSPLPADALALDTSDGADKFSRDPRGVGVPLLLIAAHEVPPDMSPTA